MARNNITIQCSINPAFTEFVKKRVIEIERLLPGLTLTDRQISYLTGKLVEEFGSENVFKVEPGRRL